MARKRKISSKKSTPCKKKINAPFKKKKSTPFKKKPVPFKNDKSIPLKKVKSASSLPGVTQQKYPMRRYEPYHEKFLSYSEIRDFLCKLHRACPRILQLSTIGCSAKGRPIYMAMISEGESTKNPKPGTMIVAGANGTHWFSVSSALFMIEQLVRGRSLVKIMDYFIIPCSNPDAYQCSLDNEGKEKVGTDLSKNFPFSLGVCDQSGISNEVFFKAIREWRENFKFDSPERLALIKTLISLQVAIKLFILLEGNGTKITYPFGFYSGKIGDVEDLKKVAKAGRNGIKCRCFGIGSTYDLDGMCFGSMVDYIKMCQSSIKFTYSIHVNEKEKVLNPCKILSYGQDVMNCVRFMARNVYMMYNQTEINSCDDFFTIIWSYTCFRDYVAIF